MLIESQIIACKIQTTVLWRYGSEICSHNPCHVLQKWVWLVYQRLFSINKVWCTYTVLCSREMGTIALAVLYGALVISCALLPKLVISLLKVKYTIAVCMLGYSVYMAAQFYPAYYTLIPGAILLGTAAAPMWSAKCTYLTEVSH